MTCLPRSFEILSLCTALVLSSCANGPTIEAAPGETPVEEVGSAQSEIIGGAPEVGFPEVVAVINAIGGLCTGTVIGPRHVLTAKHCVYRDTTATPANQLRVLVTNRIDRGEEYRVADWEAPGGVLTDEDLTSGRDIAVLTLTSSITGVVPRELAIADASPNMPITIVGFGRTNPDNMLSGIKYRGGTRVRNVFPGVFETATGARTCQGDSGGPAFDVAGRIVGVTSFGRDPECRMDSAFYSSISHMRDFIEDAMGTAARCTPRPTACNGADDDCDGIVDRGCIAVGARCSSDEQCRSGDCTVVGDQFVCTQSCDLSLADPGCPGGSVCRRSGCRIAQCVAGSNGSGGAGASCSSDDQCASGFCSNAFSGAGVCGTECRPSDTPCGDGLVCQTDGLPCGACVPSTDAPAPYGSACARNEQCASGDCSATGFCTQACSSHDQCPGRRCGADNRCEDGSPVGLGAPCANTSECVSGSSCEAGEGGMVCTLLCSAGCPEGTQCEGEICVDVMGRDLGAECSESTQCESNICAGVCTQLCDDASPCPSGFDCLPAGEVNGCFPSAPPPEMPPMEEEGGCSAAGNTGGPASASVLMLLVFGMRRRATRRR